MSEYTEDHIAKMADILKRLEQSEEELLEVQTDLLQMKKVLGFHILEHLMGPDGTLN